MNPQLQILNENGKIILKGPLSACCKKNRNGRIYPKPVLKESISKLIARVNESEVYAYNEHPNHENMIREDSAGIITEVTWNDDEGMAYCKVELLEDTKDGKFVIEAVKKGMVVGISTRALGSLDENGIVQPDLNIITADIIGANGVGIQSCQECIITEAYNSLDDYFIEQVNEACGCTFNKLQIKEQIELREKTVEKIISLFKTKDVINESKYKKSFIYNNIKIEYYIDNHLVYFKFKNKDGKIIEEHVSLKHPIQKNKLLPAEDVISHWIGSTSMNEDVSAVQLVLDSYKHFRELQRSLKKIVKQHKNNDVGDYANDILNISNKISNLYDDMELEATHLRN